MRRSRYVIRALGRAIVDAASGAGETPRPRLARHKTLALACALVAGLSMACLEPLPRGRSCGDGWWDRDYEACDASGLDRGYVSACRELGQDLDASCNEQCEIECTRCGDGIAVGDEECDGDDLRDASCPSGTGTVHCTESCTLDLSACPPFCGDGLVNGADECEPGLSCATDADCRPGWTCYAKFGECVPSSGLGADVECAHYDNTAVGLPGPKPYASGSVSRCTDFCSFGRNYCTFCGDGELDGPYKDFVFPGAADASFPGELCDGDHAREAELHAHCLWQCVDPDEPINADVELLCDFECNDTCSGFLTDNITPGPNNNNCCLAKGSPCPLFETEGVPALPCCSWSDHPEWSEDDKCVNDVTNQIPVSQVCR